MSDNQEPEAGTNVDPPSTQPQTPADSGTPPPDADDGTPADGATPPTGGKVTVSKNMLMAGLVALLAIVLFTLLGVYLRKGDGNDLKGNTQGMLTRKDADAKVAGAKKAADAKVAGAKKAAAAKVAAAQKVAAAKVAAAKKAAAAKVVTPPPPPAVAASKFPATMAEMPKLVKHCADLDAAPGRSLTSVCHDYRVKKWRKVCDPKFPAIPAFHPTDISGHGYAYSGSKLLPKTIILRGKPIHSATMTCYDVPSKMVGAAQAPPRRSYRRSYRAQRRSYTPSPRRTSRGNGEVVDRQARRDIAALGKTVGKHGKRIGTLETRQKNIRAWMLKRTRKGKKNSSALQAKLPTASVTGTPK